MTGKSRTSMHSELWVKDMLRSDGLGIDSHEAALEAAEFYGDSRRLAAVAQAAFLDGIRARFPELEPKIMPLLDQLLETDVEHTESENVGC